MKEKSLAEKRSELGNEYRKTGDTTKREVVGELEKSRYPLP